MDVKHKAQNLVHVEFDCGCSMEFSFQFDTLKPKNSSAFTAVPNGFWVSTERSPGHVDEICGHLGDGCSLAYEKFAPAKIEGLELALLYLRDRDTATRSI